MAGAALGYATLWTSLFALPLIATVQLMSSRLGMVSGRGLAGAVRAYYPKWVLLPICSLLVIANVVTIGADLGGMADATQMITGISGFIWTPVYTLGLAALLFFFSYRRIARVLKWLCLFLFAYVAAGLLSKPDWTAVVHSTLAPRIDWSAKYLSVIVAIIGATLSPYFLFWQAAQEVEEEYCLGRRTVSQRKGATREELERSQIDVAVGSFISKVITFFITLTAAATIFANGPKEIGSAREAAAALEPVAGAAASWLFAVGVIGTGALAVPVLAGSSAYSVSEAMFWRASLHEKPAFAPKFYAVLLASMLLGMALLYFGFNVIQLLFWASVLNGLLAPPCILILLLLTRKKSVMGQRANPRWMNLLGWCCFFITAAAAIAMALSFMG